MNNAKVEISNVDLNSFCKLIGCGDQRPVPGINTDDFPIWFIVNTIYSDLIVCCFRA